MGDYQGSTIQERIKKSALNARTGYDYQYLMHKHPSFLKAQIIVQGEDAEITYDIEDRKPLSVLREEDVTDCLITLQSVGDLREAAQDFKFSLNPDNLFYDQHGVVVVKSRDIYGESEQFVQEDFLAQYKSLTGFAIQKKYSFDDYYQGGGNLLNQDKFLAKIGSSDTIEGVQELLSEEAARIKADRKANYELLPKKKFSIMRILAAAFGTGLAIALGLIVFHLAYVETYKDAVIALSENYINQNYSACVASMEGIPVERMTPTEQYMLAASYVRSESVSTEQRDNLLDTLSLKDTPARLAYWIYLGRWQTEEALDIAMQLSDGQLQIYAYLKEREHVEGDASISGAEKQERIDEIEKQIEALQKQYDIVLDEEE